MTLVEICVDDLEGAVNAYNGGADRLELCREIECGGLTPTDEVVTAALEYGPSGGIQILVRPRAGDFFHSDEEVSVICTDIARLHTLTNDADIPVGFVVGALNRDFTINEDAALRMREAAGERPLTFHRAFDMVPDIGKGLETLLRLGYERVLTTGGHPQLAQPTVLAHMVEQVGEALIILGSGGLRAHNVAETIALTGVLEVHMRAPGPQGYGTDQKAVEEIMHQVRSADQQRV